MPWLLLFKTGKKCYGKSVPFKGSMRSRTISTDTRQQTKGDLYAD